MKDLMNADWTLLYIELTWMTSHIVIIWLLYFNYCIYYLVVTHNFFMIFKSTDERQALRKKARNKEQCSKIKVFFLQDILYSIQSISSCIGLKRQGHEIEF